MLLVAWVQCSRFNYVTLFDTRGKPCEHLWWVSEVEGHWRLHSLLALVGASFSTTHTQLRHIRKKKPKPLLYGCHTNNVGTCNLYHTVKSTSWISEQQHLNSNQSRQFQCRGLIISMQSHHLGRFLKWEVLLRALNITIQLQLKTNVQASSNLITKRGTEKKETEKMIQIVFKHSKLA